MQALPKYNKWNKLGNLATCNLIQIMKKIVLYCTDTCPYCDRAKFLLDAKGMDYEEIRVDLNPALRQEMMEKSHGARTVPQIFIGDDHVGGCDDLYSLDSRGKLDELLERVKMEEKKEHRKVLILGSGPAGYTAAIYAARANLSPAILYGPQKGGQLTTTTEVENFPGFKDGVDGNELINAMEAQAARFNTEMIFGQVTEADLSKRPFTLKTDDTTYTCDTLIIATGASARYLGLPSEDKYKNKGVSACATCDGFFFKGQKVAVTGGGDTALEEAIYLTNFCEKVFLVHRRQEFRASKAMQDRVKKNPKVELVLDSVVEEVIGDDNQLTDVRVKNVNSGETRDLGVQGLFVAIGHTPNAGIFKGQLDMDEQGYLTPTPGTSKMNIPGVFAAGDVMDSHYRQAITAAGSGCMSAIDAERFLAEQD